MRRFLLLGFASGKFLRFVFVVSWMCHVVVWNMFCVCILCSCSFTGFILQCFFYVSMIVLGFVVWLSGVRSWNLPHVLGLFSVFLLFLGCPFDVSLICIGFALGLSGVSSGSCSGMSLDVFGFVCSVSGICLRFVCGLFLNCFFRTS